MPTKSHHPTPPDFRVLFESGPGLYLVLTPDFMIVAASDAYLRATMTKRGGILGRGIFDVFPDNPSDPNATGVRNLSDSLERVVKGRVSDVMAVQKYDVRRPESEGGDFEERYWSPVNSPIFGANSEVAYIIHRVEDVTEFVRIKMRGTEQERLAQELRTRGEQMEAEVFLRAHQIQEANQKLRDVNEELTRLRADLERRVQERTAELRGSEERIHLLIDGVKDYAILLLDLNGNIQTWTSEAERIAGYTGEEIIGRPCSELFTQDDTDSGQLQQELQQATEHGKVDVEGWRVRKDGSRFWANGSLSALYHGDGRVRGFAKIIRDMTERHRTAQLLQSVMNHTLDGIISIDERGTIALFSRAAERIFNYLASEVVGRNVKMLMPEPYHSEHDRYLTNYLRTGEAKIIGIGREVQGRKKDGATFPLDLAVTEFEFEKHRLFLGIVRDISTQKALAEQLRQAQKMEGIGQLAAGVAHDFNNLLTAIGGRCYLVLGKLTAENPLRREIEIIQGAAERAAKLTHQLLAFSRKQILEPRVLDLNATVTGIEALLRRMIREDIEIVPVLDPAAGHVKADAGQIEQVLLNLAVNASDAMPDGGRLTLETGNLTLDGAYAQMHAGVEPGPYVMLSVSDTGHGMTAETQARIFEPFFTTKEVGKGTGLGLATVYGIVKQSGGHITVDSEVGLGTAFKLYLPRVEETPKIEGPERPAEVSRRGGSETVLLVEDDEPLRTLAREILSVQGYTVLEAATPSDALRLADAHMGPIHILLTDVVMPQMNGRQVADHVLAARPSLKVLFMSGYTDAAIVQHGVLEPGTHFLRKPFTPDGLTRKISEVLGA
jgi:two-component system cell cycle sensor histidine kinase/response regulator CckA